MKTSQVNRKGAIAPSRAQGKRPNAKAANPANRGSGFITIALPQSLLNYAERQGMEPQTAANRLLKSILEHRCVITPAGIPMEGEAARGACLMLALEPGLPEEALFEHLVLDACRQAAHDADLAAGYAASALEEMKENAQDDAWKRAIGTWIKSRQSEKAVVE